MRAVAIVDSASIPASLMRAVIHNHIGYVIQMLKDFGAVQTTGLIGSLDYTRVPVSPIYKFLSNEIKSEFENKQGKNRPEHLKNHKVTVPDIELWHRVSQYL